MDSTVKFIDRLRQITLPNVFNPWQDYDELYDIDSTAPTVRALQLTEYLNCRVDKAKYLFLAEGLSYQGGKFTGIAMTSERMLLGNHNKVAKEHILSKEGRRTSNPSQLKSSSSKLGMAEPTASIVWSAILRNKISPWQVVLWNIFPWHPYKGDQMLTNRTPEKNELELGLEYTKMLLEILPGNIRIITLGNKSWQTLPEPLQAIAINLRHPANGGATIFNNGLELFCHTNNVCSDI